MVQQWHAVDFTARQRFTVAASTVADAGKALHTEAVTAAGGFEATSRFPYSAGGAGWIYQLAQVI